MNNADEGANRWPPPNERWPFRPEDKYAAPPTLTPTQARYLLHVWEDGDGAANEEWPIRGEAYLDALKALRRIAEAL